MIIINQEELIHISQEFITQDEIVFPVLTMETFIIIIVILVLWFISGILSALWVKKDIKRNGLVGSAYIIIVSLTSFIGLSVYLIVRYNAKCALEEDEAACIMEELKKD